MFTSLFHKLRKSQPNSLVELRQRMEGGGLVSRPTVVKLQHKVQLLHEDVTKHWIVTELALLQKRLDQSTYYY